MPALTRWKCIGTHHTYAVYWHINIANINIGIMTTSAGTACPLSEELLTVWHGAAKTNWRSALTPHLDCPSGFLTLLSIGVIHGTLLCHEVRQFLIYIPQRGPQTGVLQPTTLLAYHVTHRAALHSRRPRNSQGLGNRGARASGGGDHNSRSHLLSDSAVGAAGIKLQPSVNPWTD